MKRQETMSDMGELVVEGILDQASPFIIRGDMAVLQELAATMPKEPVTKVAETVVAATVAVPSVRDEYINYNGVDGRTLARTKLSARLYDLVHRTNMYGLLVEKINDDRNVAYAQRLGLIGTDRCAKHERATRELAGREV